MQLFTFFVCIHIDIFKVLSLQARSIDPHIITYMDEYAMLLMIKSDHLKLNKLVHDLLSIDPTRPEVFVALSVVWERKEERGALSYAEKVSLLIWSVVDCFPSLIIYLTIPSLQPEYPNWWEAYTRLYHEGTGITSHLIKTGWLNLFFQSDGMHPSIYILDILISYVSLETQWSWE